MPDSVFSIDITHPRPNDRVDYYGTYPATGDPNPDVAGKAPSVLMRIASAMADSINDVTGSEPPPSDVGHDYDFAERFRRAFAELPPSVRGAEGIGQNPEPSIYNPELKNWAKIYGTAFRMVGGSGGTGGKSNGYILSLRLTNPYRYSCRYRVEITQQRSGSGVQGPQGEGDSLMLNDLAAAVSELEFAPRNHGWGKIISARLRGRPALEGLDSVYTVSLVEPRRLADVRFVDVEIVHEGERPVLGPLEGFFYPDRGIVRVEEKAVDYPEPDRETQPDRHFFWSLDRLVYPARSAGGDKAVAAELRRLARRLLRRTQDRGRTHPSPGLAAAETRAARPAISSAAAQMKALLYTYWGLDGGGLDTDAVWEAFRDFASGKLGASTEGLGEPNGLGFLSFAELGLSMYLHYGETDPWKELSEIFCAASEVFLCTYKIGDRLDGGAGLCSTRAGGYDLMLSGKTNEVRAKWKSQPTRVGVEKVTLFYHYNALLHEHLGACRE